MQLKKQTMGHLKHTELRKKSWQWLAVHRLRQACCHPQTVRGGYLPI